MVLRPGVHPAGPEDFARLLDVWEASVRATHHFVAEADLLMFRPLVWDSLHDAGAHLACVRAATGEAAGFIRVTAQHIDMLFIHPEGRGLGLGRRLLEHAFGSFGALTVDVNEQNEQAVGFYRHMGFEAVGRSERDGSGKPYPILNLRLNGARVSHEH